MESNDGLVLLSSRPSSKQCIGWPVFLLFSFAGWSESTIVYSFPLFSIKARILLGNSRLLPSTNVAFALSFVTRFFSLTISECISSCSVRVIPSIRRINALSLISGLVLLALGHVLLTLYFEGFRRKLGSGEDDLQALTLAYEVMEADALSHSDTLDKFFLDFEETLSKVINAEFEA